MSTELVVREIKRFLASDTAEVLCIRGRWGIGKTFAWRRYLDEMRRAGTLKSQDYAYVSLFGLNSLDELRYAIFESTVPPERALTGPDEGTFQTLVDKGKTVGRKGRSWLGPALSAVGLGEIGNAVARSAFLLVRSQLICLDDLERAGNGLAPRDVLGLVSFLKEQRNCRVALLLNDEAMAGDEQQDFRRLLEKVIDTSIIFEPTPGEAATIAILGSARSDVALRRHVQSLGITNIRVIKKIERLIFRLTEMLATFSDEVLDQAVAACVLGGWSVLEPDTAPTMAFLRDYNAIIASMKPQGGDLDDTIKWRDKLAALPWSHTDHFDGIIFDGVASGYFNEEQLRDAASTLQAALRRQGGKSAFGIAWDHYHWSLMEDDDAVLDRLFDGALKTLPDVEISNVNATVRLLREFGHGDQADKLVEAYAAAMPNEPRYFDLSVHYVGNEPVDGLLTAAIEAKRAAYNDPRDPRAVLLEVSRDRGWNDEDERLFARMSSDQLESLIEGVQGKELRQAVQRLMQMAAHAGHDSDLRITLGEALTRIAMKSPLRARRLKAWGFPPPSDHPD